MKVSYGIGYEVEGNDGEVVATDIIKLQSIEIV